MKSVGKIVLIDEENHGLIGIADSYKSALLYLINENWNNDYTDIYVGNNEWKRISEVFGEDWLDKMMEWDIPNFNEYWEGSFHLFVEDIVGIE